MAQLIPLEHIIKSTSSCRLKSAKCLYTDISGTSLEGLNMHESEEVTVLLIEDNQVDVMGVQRAFKNFPNPMIVANDGLDALEKLRGENVVKRPYIVLLDLNMPRMNGVEFLEEIRDDHDLKNSIVFVLTTSNAPDDRQQVFDHHVAGYIVKGKTGGGFMDAASLLNRYAQICEIP